ncbi:AraC-like DNA-binding protein [Luteibacter sp. 1214]|nr:AraC-like DNA-binding protein [Luteibacter sp. 1214]
MFGVPASALVGRTIPIEAIWSRSAAEDLIGKLSDARDSATAASVLEDVIALRVASTPMDARHGFVRRAAGLLEHANVGDVSTQLGISDRHLRRVFQEVTGLNPKTFARLKRFDRAVSSALNNGESNWSSVAVDAGYYDQAHLIADFHVIAGTTPQKFLAEVRDQRRLIAFR